jgi:ADP-ribose pyrophosphatase
VPKSSQEPAPWRRLSTGEPIDYGILRVRQDRVADPRTSAEYARVVIEASDWVNIIPVTPDDQVILIRQFRFGVWRNTLEIPGGLIEPGEDPMAAAARELEEETGYVPSEVIALGHVHPNPALQTNRTFSYLALGCQRAHDGHQESAEDIAVELHPRLRIPAMIRDGQISHALVVAAFYLAHARGGDVPAF